MCTYLSKRGATYYFRRVIPIELRPAFGGKAQFMVSLRTKDRDRAKQLIPAQTMASEKQLDAARGQLGKSPKSAPETPQRPSTRHAEIEGAQADYEEEAAAFFEQEDLAREARQEARQHYHDLYHRRMRLTTQQLEPWEAAIKDMLAAHAEGAEIVYGVRRHRQTDTWFKRLSAEAYYSVLRAIGVQLIFNHADYRLLGRRAIEALRSYNETNLFLRGVIPQLGFRSALVYYDRRERFAGVSKYPFSKMVALAIEGITSFSDVPLKLITILGLLISLASFGLAIWALWVRITNPAAVPGWASIVIPLYMLGGIQLLCMGVIGQYVVKIYAETKSRPRFIIEKEL